MSVLDDIRGWLSAPDSSFERGLELLSSVEPNAGLVAFIRRKKDRRGLEYHLRKRLKCPPRRLIAKAPSAPAPQDPQPGTLPRQYRRTRREDLPERLRPVYDGIVEKYRLQRAAHERMKLLSVLPERREETAQSRAQVTALEKEIRSMWEFIDSSLDAPATDAAGRKAGTAPPFNVSSYRSFITRAIARKEIPPERRAEVMRRVEEMLRYGIPISDKTVERLRSLGLFPKT